MLLVSFMDFLQRAFQIIAHSIFPPCTCLLSLNSFYSDCLLVGKTWALCKKAKFILALMLCSIETIPHSSALPDVGSTIRSAPYWFSTAVPATSLGASVNDNIIRWTQNGVLFQTGSAAQHLHKREPKNSNWNPLQNSYLVLICT